MNKIKILIVDDHSLIRQSWKLVLSTDFRFEVVADTANGFEALELVTNHAPDIAIVDINMPGLSGIDLTEMIRKNSSTKVLCVSGHTSYTCVKKVMQKGASGYLTKSGTIDEFFTALSEVARGAKYISIEMRERLAEQMLNNDEQKASVEDLSERELEVISLVRDGYTSKEIAKKLYISVKTVEVHRFNILRKLKLKNSAALVNFMSRKDTVYN